MMKRLLQEFWQNFEYGKMQKFGFCLQDFFCLQIFFSKTTQQNS